MPKVLPCPDVTQYKKLASAHVSAAEKQGLVNHLEACDSCVQRLDGLADTDTLIELIRQAQTQGDGPGADAVARLVERFRQLRLGAGPAAKVPAPATMRVPCPACGKRLKVKNELAGKKVKCPHCQEVLAVPNSAPPAGEERTPPPSPLAAPAQTVVSAVASSFRAVEHPAKADAPQVDPAGAHQHLTDFLAPPQAPDEIGRLGEYRVLKVLGAGGMGVVFQAEDAKLKRKVALKVMLPALGASATGKQRFLREAQTAATIEHDHIVPIFQIGEDRGVLFIAMPFLKGESLDEKLKRDKSLPLTEVRQIGREVAKGLGAAHAAGLVHRDIKPANLWLEILPNEPGLSTPGFRVKILDFGLARAAADNAQLTQQGAIIGTPAYMAPEQAEGRALDGRCDLFSLGCVLYRMCTGSPAFKGTDMVSTLVSVAMDNPLSPLELRPDVPAALSDLVMRLLAKKPEERPRSAQAVVEALQEIEAMADSGATPKRKLPQAKRRRLAWLDAGRTRAYRPLREPPRWPWLVGMAGVPLAIVMAGIVVFWPAPCGLVKVESDDPDVAIVFDKTGPTVKGAGTEPIALRAGEHGVLIKRGDFEFEADKFLLKKGAIIALKVELLKDKIQVSANGEVIGAKELPAAAVANVPAGKAPKAAREVPSAVPADAWRRERISPYELAVAGGGDPEKAPAALVAVLGDSRLNHWSLVKSISYSPDGKTLATGSLDGSAGLWDPGTGKLLRLLDGHEGRVFAVSFSPDGKTLATAGDDGTVKLWEPASGRLLRTFAKQRGLIHSVAFSPDGSLLAAAVHHGPPGVRIWETGTGRLRSAYDKLPDEKVCSVAFSPDGKSLAAVGGRWWGPSEGKGWLRLYDLEKNEERYVLSTEPEILLRVAFSPNGKVLAPTGYESTVRLRDADTGVWVRQLKGHGSWVTGVAFSPDGKTLATGCHDIRLWDVAAGKERARLLGYFWFAEGMAFSPDGKVLASGHGDQGTIRLWDVAAARELPISTGHNRSLMHVAISPDGKMVAAGGYEDPVRLWDVASGEQRRVLKGHGWGLTCATAFSPIGGVLASAGNDRTIRLWDATTGRLLKTLTGHEAAVTALSFSRDGQTLASGSDDKMVAIWDTAKGEASVRMPGHTAAVRAVAISPDGKTLASAGDDKTVRLWDLAKNQLRATLSGHTAPIRSAAFTPDGQTLISAGDDKDVKLWDLSKNELRLSLLGHTAGVTCVVVSPDGRTLASAGGDGTVRLRDAVTGRLRETIQVGPRFGAVNQLAFAPDGCHLMTANGNGTIYVLLLNPPPPQAQNK